MRTFNLLVALSAAIAIFLSYSDNFFLFSVFKALTTILLICGLLKQRNYLPTRLFSVLLIALIGCLAGDVLLLNDLQFVAGLSAFLLAHLLFIWVFVILGGWSKNFVVLLVLLVIAGTWFWYLEPSLGEFRVPVAVYSTVIVVMAWQGIGLALNSTVSGRSMVAYGAVLFMFSDSMIALNKFVLPFELSAFVILSTYWLALMLILNSVLCIAKNQEGE